MLRALPTAAAGPCLEQAAALVPGPSSTLTAPWSASSPSLDPTPSHSMARLDKVKNLTGLAEWYAGNERLRGLANLVIVGGCARGRVLWVVGWWIGQAGGLPAAGAGAAT